MKSIKFNTLFLAAITLAVAASFFLFSCQREEVAAPNNQFEDPLQQVEGKFKKQVTLRDASGDNWMLLEVSANSAEELANWPVEHFTLSPVRSDAEPIAPPARTPTPAETTSLPDPTSPHYFLNLLEEHRAPGVTSLSIKISSPKDVQDRGWLASGNYTFWVSACGFGCRFSRITGSSFYVYHYYGDNCQVASNNFQGVYHNYNYYSSGYFWGRRMRFEVHIPRGSGGDYNLEYGQFPAGGQ